MQPFLVESVSSKPMCIIWLLINRNCAPAVREWVAQSKKSYFVVVGFRGSGALSLKGNLKRYGGFPNLVIQPAKNCVHPPIVRVASAASFNLEPSTWTLKGSPNFPLLRDAHFLFSIKKFKSMWLYQRSHTWEQLSFGWVSLSVLDFLTEKEKLAIDSLQ